MTSSKRTLAGNRCDLLQQLTEEGDLSVRWLCI